MGVRSIVVGFMESASTKMEPCSAGYPIIALLDSLEEETKLLRLPALDFRHFRIACTSRNTFVGVGFDCNPIVFNLGQNGFEFADKCDQQQQGGVIKSSMNMWQQMDTKGTTAGTTDLKTRHKNSILEVKPCNSGFSTCGADGQIIQWSWSSLSQKLANLRI